MFSLADPEKRVLLSVARRAIAATLEPSTVSQEMPSDATLLHPAGAFVTLLKRGRLRGCVGQLPSGLPLIQVVVHCAQAVVSEDPRFKPLGRDELDAVEIEISVLSEPYEIRPEQIHAGIHGLIVSNGKQRGVLLPQVAAQFGWSGIRFLEATCEKAGLSPHAWKESGTGILAFTAIVFSETSLLMAGGSAKE